MPGEPELNAALKLLESELRKLEIEYNMFFAGHLPRPPWETRARVEALLRKIDHVTGQARSYADRFRFQTLQSRYSTFADLWDRGLKAREEGRPGPFVTPRRTEPEPGPPPPEPEDRILHVTVFHDPIHEMDKMRELYERLTAAREELGEPQLPFHRFAGLIREQVKSLKKKGAPEVAFRLSVQDGKITFTARALKGHPDEPGKAPKGSEG